MTDNDRDNAAATDDADPCEVCGDCQCPECGTCLADHSEVTDG